jgi:hypothetical protein
MDQSNSNMRHVSSMLRPLLLKAWLPVTQVSMCSASGGYRPDKMQQLWECVAHFVLPSCYVPSWAEDSVVDKMNSCNALVSSKKWAISGLLLFASGHVCCHTWAHLPAIREAGFMPDPDGEGYNQDSSSVPLYAVKWAHWLLSLLSVDGVVSPQMIECCSG